MDELKLCPFCGSEAKIIRTEYHSIPIEQVICGSETCYMHHIAVRKDHWDCRPIEAEKAEQIRKLEYKYKKALSDIIDLQAENKQLKGKIEALEQDYQAARDIEESYEETFNEKDNENIDLKAEVQQQAEQIKKLIKERDNANRYKEVLINWHNPPVPDDPELIKANLQVEWDALEDGYAKQISKLRDSVHKLLVYKDKSVEQAEQLKRLEGTLSLILTKCSGYDGYDSVEGLKKLIDVVVMITVNQETTQLHNKELRDDIKLMAVRKLNHKINMQNASVLAKNQQLKEFARRIIRSECWGYVDGGDIEDIAEQLGLIKPHIATEADVDPEHDDFEVGDTIYKFTGILEAAEPQKGQDDEER